MLVVEADARGVGAGAGVIDAVEPRPVDGGEAHWAGLAARIDLAAGKIERSERPARFGDRDDLGMRGRIVGGGDAIAALGQDAIVLDDHGAKRAARVPVHALARQREGAAHECFLAHAELASLPAAAPARWRRM